MNVDFFSRISSFLLAATIAGPTAPPPTPELCAAILESSANPSLLERPLVKQLTSLHDQLLTMDDAQAKTTHLLHNVPLAQEMLEQIKRRFKLPDEFERITETYITQLEAEGKIHYDYDGALGPIYAEWNAKPLIDFLKTVNVPEVTARLKDAIYGRRLTYEVMLDLSIKWTLLMTAVDARDAQQPFRLNLREQMRLLEFLNGNRNIFIQLFPVAMVSFHRKPLAVETIAGISARPIGPVALLTHTQEFEDETMSPLEALLHDLYHLMTRLAFDHNYVFHWLPLSYRPKAETTDLVPDHPYEATTDQKKNFRERLLSQLPFHEFIFTEILKLPINLRLAVEVIWFQMHFAADNSDYPKDTGITAWALLQKIHLYKEKLARGESWTLELASKAKDGKLGTRYTSLKRKDLAEGLIALEQLAKKAHVPGR